MPHSAVSVYALLQSISLKLLLAEQVEFELKSGQRLAVPQAKGSQTLQVKQRSNWSNACVSSSRCSSLHQTEQSRC